MPALASRPQQSGPAGGEVEQFTPKRTVRRSSWRALTWVAGLVLIGVLASVATGLIPDRAHKELIPLEAPVEGSSTRAPNGWGPLADFKGHYHVVGATLEHAGKTIKLDEGLQELTIYPFHPNQEAVEEEGKEAATVETGLLQVAVPANLGGGPPTLGSATLPEVLQLSELSSTLGVATAKIRINSPTKGPIVGYFEATSSAPGRLEGTAYVRGTGTIHAEFVRFSTVVEELSEGAI